MHDGPGDLHRGFRATHHQRSKRLAEKSDQSAVHLGAHGRRAGLAGDEGHLADALSRIDERDASLSSVLVRDEHAKTPTDEMKVIGVLVALRDESFATFEVNPLRQGIERLQVFARQYPEHTGGREIVENINVTHYSSDR